MSKPDAIRYLVHLQTYCTGVFYIHESTEFPGVYYIKNA